MVELSTLPELGATYGVPVARALMAAVFLYSGQDKLRHWRAGVEEVTGLGLPMPGLFALQQRSRFRSWAALSWVLLGVGAPWGAAVLALFTATATAFGHRFWLLHGQPARQEFDDHS